MAPGVVAAAAVCYIERELADEPCLVVYAHEIALVDSASRARFETVTCTLWRRVNATAPATDSTPVPSAAASEALHYTRPHYSVAQVTTPGLTFSEALAVYSETGADGIGIDIGTLRGDAADAARLRDSGLRATYCSLPVSSVLPIAEVPGLPASGAPTDPRSRVEIMCEGVRRLAAFEPLGCFVAPGPCGECAPDAAREIVVDAVARIARVAAECGMAVALEPLHPSLADLFSFINDLPAAAALIADAGEPNVGIIVDIWHLSDKPGFPSDLAEHASLVSLVHLNDRAPVPRSWCDRLLPGEGTADLPGILAMLARRGYDGWYELEVISDDGRFGNAFPDSLWQLHPAKLLRRARANFLDAWNASVDSA